MTCIAAIAEAGRVYLGADSLVACGSDIILCADPKVWTAGSFAVGAAGTVVWLELLRDRLRWDRISGCTTETEFRRALTTEIRQHAKDEGLDFEDDEESSGGDAILGVAGRLYRFDSFLTVQRVSEGFTACGSGASPALGVLFATRRRGLKPRDRLTMALTAAERYTTTVRRPWRFVEV